MKKINVLIPSDHSAAVDQVIKRVHELFSGQELAMHLVHVVQQSRYKSHYEILYVEQPELESELVKRNQALVREKATELKAQGLDVIAHCILGEIEEDLMDFCKKQSIDLIAMPTHGRQGMPRLFIGSTAERIMRISSVPVMTFRLFDA